MKEAGRDSSGSRIYISTPESVLSVVADLTGLACEYIKTSEKKDGSRAREIIALLLVENLDASFLETGHFLQGLTGPAIKKHKTRGARRLRSDEEFAHTFAVAEKRSNTAEYPL